VSLDPMPSARELRAMAARKGILPPNSPAVPSKGTKAPSGPWHPFRSKWELEYAKYLDVMKAAGQIRDWAYEGEHLDIGIGARYTPDFRLVCFDGLIQYREVKGYKREAAMVRLKVAAKLYPQYTFVLVTKKDGSWVHTPIK